jgi:hypothetical protein
MLLGLGHSGSEADLLFWEWSGIVNLLRQELAGIEVALPTHLPEEVGSPRCERTFFLQPGDLLCDLGPDTDAGLVVRPPKLLDFASRYARRSAAIPSPTCPRIHDGNIFRSNIHETTLFGINKTAHLFRFLTVL